MKAVFNNITIAESDKTISFEGNTYFPKDSIIEKYFKKSKASSICDEKGVAHYYNVEVNNKFRDEAAWCLPQRTSSTLPVGLNVIFNNEYSISHQSKSLSNAQNKNAYASQLMPVIFSPKLSYIMWHYRAIKVVLI